jgi:hypothetical protein
VADLDLLLGEEGHQLLKLELVLLHLLELVLLHLLLLLLLQLVQEPSQHIPYPRGRG